MSITITVTIVVTQHTVCTVQYDGCMVAVLAGGAGVRAVLARLPTS